MVLCDGTSSVMSSTLSTTTYGWVLPIEEVGENPQLDARDWWATYSIGEHVVKGPGTPYRFSQTPWQMKPYVDWDVDADRVLQDLGWDSDR